MFSHLILVTDDLENPISTRFRPYFGRQQKSLIWPWQSRSRSTIYLTRLMSGILYEWFSLNFHRIDGNVAGNKNVISWPWNVGQGHRLQKLSPFLYDWFQPNFHQSDAVGAGNKSVTSADLGNVGQGHMSQRVISQLLSNRFEPNVLHEWWRLYRNCHVFVQTLISLPSITASSKCIHPTNQPFIYPAVELLLFYII